jgi:hypothetical protein
MYGGAGLSVIYSVAVGVTSNSLFMATSAQPATFHAGYVAGVVIEGLIQVSLWLWMAWKTKAGRSWARVVSSVFFGLMCLQLFVVLAGPSAFPKVAAGAEWIVGISALILLWQRESSAFFTATKQPTAVGYYGAGPLPGPPPYPPAGYPASQPYGQSPVGQPPYGQQPPQYGQQPPYGQPPQ